MSEILDIYKLAVEMADRVSTRRMTANGFFLTVETTLIAVYGFYFPAVTQPSRWLALVIVSSAGIILAATWFLAIRSYRRLNRAKFAVINKLEKDHLPVQYFTDEWANLKGAGDEAVEPKKLRERWQKLSDRYTDLTTIETVVPGLFVVVNLAALIGAIWKAVA